MASITVKIPTVPTRSDNDTIISYNVYSNQPSANTLIGTMTPSEAAAGKVMTFSDGVTHSTTAKAVWATAGESAIATVAVNITTSGGGSTIVFIDNFTGTTLDTTTKWDLTEPAPATLDVSQNEKLIGTHSSTSSSAFGTYVAGKNSYDITAIKSFTFDLQTANLNNFFAIGLSKDAAIVDSQNNIFIQHSTNTTSITCTVKTSGTASSQTVTLDLTTLRTLKIDINGGNAIFQYHNGTSWQTLATIAMGMTGNFRPFVTWWNSSGSTGATDVDNLAITNALFTTLRPV